MDELSDCNVNTSGVNIPCELCTFPFDPSRMYYYTCLECVIVSK